MSSQEASMQKKTVTKSTHLFSRIVRRFRSTPKSFEATTFPTQTKLCTICENLISNYEDRGWHPSSPFMFREARNITVPHHENLVSFERAVAEGCALCNHLSISAAQNITRLRERYQGFPELGFALELQHISWEEGMTMRWNACRPTSHFPQNDEGHDRTLAELWLRKANQVHLGSLEASTNSEKTFKDIQSWYHQCENTHKDCSNPKDTPLPSRLLYIQNTSVRLCESSNLPFPWSKKRPQYAALSHCWGEIDFIKLLQSNLEHFLVEIPLDQLTKTFRDAITITQSLGLSFLWIDSLCIIQNSIQDWRKESALMADVYGGSAITIAAADAENGSIGCFFQLPHKENSSLLLKTTTKVYTVDELMSQASAVKNSLLVKRGWVFQERFLSPKTLHFTRTQVFWKCRSGELASQAYPNGIPSSTYSYHETLTDTMVRTPSVSKLRSWLDIVTRYSATDLTHHTDKLIALSGVAKWYQEHHKLEREEYLAGIWKGQLWHGLLWMVNSSKKSDRPVEYQAPSWSWASQNKEVTFTIGLKIQYSSPYVSLISHHITYPDQSVFGQVSGGHLRLRCTNLLLAPWAQEEGSSSFHLHLDREAMDYSLTWDHEPDREKKAYLLPILEYKLPPGYKPAPTKRDRIRLQGIVLQTSGKNIGTFRRVGFFDLMSGGRKPITTPGPDPALHHSWGKVLPAGYVWKEATAYFKDVEETLDHLRGIYIPEEEVYESRSVEEKDGERGYEIIIV